MSATPDDTAGFLRVWAYTALHWMAASTWTWCFHRWGKGLTGWCVRKQDALGDWLAEHPL